ncbi:hypothetical protein PAPYR_9660 [Paratrimastix pyriformis]|uniref:Uncharacterized protein n=1 Tax=Paratrimastix pyriformis TaxID=342808 RepID=A0ABQ8U7S1_9EUKA|nr:hypothetical protein PAPYR_9660 [Paratrimastix pyriformis]
MELDESAGSLAPAGPAPQGQAPVTGEAAGMVGSSVSGEESGAAAPAASAPASLGASASSGAVASSGPGAPQVPVWLLLVQVRPLFGAVEGGPRYHSGGNAAFSTSLGSFCERGT